MPKDVATALRTSVEECATICRKLQQEPFNFTAADMADITIRLLHCTEQDLQVPQLTVLEQVTLMHAIDIEGEVGAGPRAFN